MKLRQSQVLISILILSMAGVGLATFLTANHYRLVDAGICEIGPWSSCEDVNTGPYSEIFPGLPWAVVGLAGFVFLFVLSYLKLYFPDLDKRDMFIPLMLLVSVIGVIFVVYLNYLEFAVIHKICIFCAISHVLMIVILGLAAWLEYARRHMEEMAGEEAESDSG